MSRLHAMASSALTRERGAVSVPVGNVVAPMPKEGLEARMILLEAGSNNHWNVASPGVNVVNETPEPAVEPRALIANVVGFPFTSYMIMLTAPAGAGHVPML